MAQIIAVIIFLLMFIMIVTEIFPKHYVTLGCGLLTLVLVFGFCMHDVEAVKNTLNLHTIFTSEFWHTTSEAGESSSGINWATIIFIGGMMIMVEGMARVGFFRWLCMKIAKLVDYKNIRIFIAFMIMSFILAMFIDSITVILFLAAVTIELSQLLQFNCVPMILAEIFCANLGGSATMCGDPPNIIIGTSLGFSFFDFLLNTGLMAFICLFVVIVYFYFAFRKELKPKEGFTIDIDSLPTPASCITDQKGFILSTIVFGIAVVLLVTHANTGLTVAFIGVFVSILTLIVNRKHLSTIMKGVDYHTLLFFIGLFIVVGGLEQTGVLEIIAGFIGEIAGSNIKLMVTIIIWVSAVASAFVDNIPFSATMIPIIRTLSTSFGADLNILAWALAMGTDIGGSATPIGASANVVGTSAASNAGHPIGWGEYCKKLAPATIIVIAICNILIFIRYC